MFVVALLSFCVTGISLFVFTQCTRDAPAITSLLTAVVSFLVGMLFVYLHKQQEAMNKLVERDRVRSPRSGEPH